jgi:2-polyprenyl-3-methyl-5-hydroxy-6-metoxy-1,4-benzoquinol methylase
LAEIPFQYNTNDFHFDNEIIIQLVGKGKKIVEVPIPTYYGDEISHVNGLAYAYHCLSTVMRWRANQVFLVYHPKFDLEAENPYVYKQAPTSVHKHVVTREYPGGTKILEIGAGHGQVGLAIHERGDVEVVAVDLRRPEREFPCPFLEVDLNDEFADDLVAAMGGPADVVVALDVIEHLSRPEASLRQIKKTLRPEGRLVASTGNIAFVMQRIMLGLGQFNYGKKGILDLTHQRLFSVRSFCRTLEGEGFKVESIRGFGPPIRDMVGDTFFLRALDRLGAFLGRIWPRLFGYQFLVEAKRLDEIDDILASTLESESAETVIREKS